MQTMNAARSARIVPAAHGQPHEVLSRPCWPPASGLGPRHPRAGSIKPLPLSYVGVRRASFLGLSSVPMLVPPFDVGEGMSPDQYEWAAGENEPEPPPISRSDSDFETAIGVQFIESREGVVLTELNDLFDKVGFPRRDPVLLELALKNTYHCVWVRCAKKTRMARMGQMVGFARATSDGALTATIWDVAVNPGWQRAGLGRAMMERLTRKLVQDGIPTVTLYAEPGVVGLYEKLGYVKDPEGIRGMSFQRRKKAAAAGKR